MIDAYFKRWWPNSVGKYVHEFSDKSIAQAVHIHHHHVERELSMMAFHSRSAVQTSWRQLFVFCSALCTHHIIHLNKRWPFYRSIFHCLYITPKVMNAWNQYTFHRAILWIVLYHHMDSYYCDGMPELRMRFFRLIQTSFGFYVVNLWFWVMSCPAWPLWATKNVIIRYDNGSQEDSKVSKAENSIGGGVMW